MSTPDERKAAFDGVVDKILAPFADTIRTILKPSLRRAWDEGYNNGLSDGQRSDGHVTDNPFEDAS